MPHRRRVRKGSFGSHLDELIAHFPAHEDQSPPTARAPQRDPKLQEKIDIHALLFEQAWEVERDR
jgi:hypothetical protein